MLEEYSSDTSQVVNSHESRRPGGLDRVRSRIPLSLGHQSPSRTYSASDFPRAAYQEQVAWSYAPRTHKFESVDFRTPSSALNTETLFARTRREERAKHVTAHVIVIGVGLVVGLLAFLIQEATSRLHWCLYAATQALLDRPDTHPGIAAIVFTFLSGFYLAVSASLVVFASPIAAGSGIPEIKSYLNGIRIPGLLKLRTLLVKTVGLIFALSGGILSGKQGPLNHIGSIIGAAMSQGASSFFRFRVHSHWFRPFRTEEAKRDFAAVGSAVGVSVAFGAPLGGTLWAMEEAVTHWSQPLTWITAVGCTIGSFTAGLLSNAVEGKATYLALSAPIGSAGATDYTRARLVDFVCFIGLGLIGGVLGSILPFLTGNIARFRYRFIASPQLKLAEAIIIGCLTAAARFVISYAAGDCQATNESVELVIGTETRLDFSRFACPKSQIDGGAIPGSVWASLIYNPLITSLRALLHVADPEAFPPATLCITILFYMILTLLTHGTAVPNGLFAPVMLLGAAYGRLAFALSQYLFGGTGYLVRLYALVGAASALGGVTRLSVSTTVLLVEATQVNMADGFPSIFAGIIAKLVGDSITMNVFDVSIALKGLPFFTSRITEPQLYYRALVRDIMSDKVVAVRTKSTIGDLVDTLQAHKHNSFPVYQNLPPLIFSENLDPIAVNRPKAIKGNDQLVREYSRDRVDSLQPPTSRPFSGGSSTDTCQVSCRRDQPIATKNSSRPEMVAIVPPVSKTIDEDGVEDSDFPSPYSLASKYIETHAVSKQSPSIYNPCNLTGDSFVQSNRDAVPKPSGTQGDVGSISEKSQGHRSEQALDGIISRIDLIALIDHCIGKHSIDADWQFNSYELTRENFDSAWPRGEYVHMEEDILAGVHFSLRSKT